MEKESMMCQLIAPLMFVSLFFYHPFVLVAQEGSASNLIEGAKKEGQVVWYTTMNVSQGKPVVDAFQKKYPFVEPVLYPAGGGALVNPAFLPRLVPANTTGTLLAAEER